MNNAAVEAMNTKMEKSMETFKKELARIRTGRASLSILDGIFVDAYGSPMALHQMASMSIPESRTIVIQPWDPRLLSAVEKTLLKSDLGLTPTNDGKVVRITIPMLTEERRKGLVKQVKKIAEEYKVVVRNLRRETIEALKKQKKNKEISEDDLFKLQDQVQKGTDDHTKKIDDILLMKEKEVMEV